MEDPHAPVRISAVRCIVADPRQPALADEPSTHAPRPKLVVTATRVPTPIVDIPAGVTVIDRQTIEQRGYTTLTDALSAVPGVRVSQSGGPGGNASVFVRGTNSNQVLVLRDGMPLNDASDSSGAFNFGMIRWPMSSASRSSAARWRRCTAPERSAG